MHQGFWNSFASLRFTPRLARGLVVGALLCTTSLSFALPFDDEDDDTEAPTKGWQEMAVQLPPAPQAADLIDFYVSPLATATSYIDIKSLTLGSDNALRYTLITKTSGGATNISYEGIRCETFEKRVYAFGRPDGTWSPSHQKAWKQIVDAGGNRQDAALYKAYFCEGGMVAGNLSAITNRLRRKQPLDLTGGR